MDGKSESPETPDFETLTWEHKDSVYRQMLRVCGNREDAEDVLVEALLKAYRHLNQLRDSAAFRAWLAQIAKRVCRQLKEREALMPLLQRSRLEEEGREILGGELTPEGHLARRPMKQLLDDAIAALPSLYRSVYQLRDIEDRAGRGRRGETGNFTGSDEIAVASGAESDLGSSGCSPGAGSLALEIFIGGTHGSYSRTSRRGTV